MGVIISNIATVFIIMGVGFFANKIGLLPEKANDYLAPLLIQVTAPCMVFSNIVCREIGDGMMGEVLMAILISALFFIIFCFIGWFICVKLLKLGKNENCGVLIMLFGSVNNGFMGFPITLAVFGEEKLFFMVFFQMVLMIFLYGPGLAIINYGGEKKQSSKGVLLKAILGPNTLAAIIGLIILFAGLSLPEFITRPIDLIGDATTPLSMIVIGIQLGSSNFRRIFKNKDLTAVSLLKMIICPVVTFLLLNWLPIPDVIKIVFVFGAAFPSAVAVTPIAATEGKDALLAAEGVALTTLMSLVTIPVAAYVLSLLYM